MTSDRHHNPAGQPNTDQSGYIARFVGDWHKHRLVFANSRLFRALATLSASTASTRYDNVPPVSFKAGVSEILSNFSRRSRPRLSIAASVKLGIAPFNRLPQSFHASNFHELALVVAAGSLDRKINIERSIQRLHQAHGFETLINRLLGLLHQIRIDDGDVTRQCDGRGLKLISWHHAIDEADSRRFDCWDAICTGQNDFLGSLGADQPR